VAADATKNSVRNATSFSPPKKIGRTKDRPVPTCHAQQDLETPGKRVVNQRRKYKQQHFVSLLPLAWPFNKLDQPEFLYHGE
jgi:hypothetical protein